MKTIFTKHPQSIGESYWQHFWVASSFGFKMMLAGFACLIHAFLPFLFEKTGSNCLLKLIHEFLERMPATEERIVHLADCLEKKTKKS